jgi:hypothetical protein
MNKLVRDKTRFGGKHHEISHSSRFHYRCALIPAISFAQSNQPLTCAEVKARLAQIESADYNPATANSYDCPANIQRAEARAAAQYGTAAGSYGGVTNTTSSVRCTRQFGSWRQCTVNLRRPLRVPDAGPIVINSALRYLGVLQQADRCPEKQLETSWQEVNLATFG